MEREGGTEHWNGNVSFMFRFESGNDGETVID